MILVSAAEFGDKVARKKSPQPTNVYSCRVYQGMELTCLALGLLMEKNLKLSCWSELLEEHKFWRQLRVNLALHLDRLCQKRCCGPVEGWQELLLLL